MEPQLFKFQEILLVCFAECKNNFDEIFIGGFTNLRRPQKFRTNNWLYNKTNKLSQILNMYKVRVFCYAHYYTINNKLVYIINRFLPKNVHL